MDKEILFKTNALILANVELKSTEFKVFNKILFNCQKTKDNELKEAILSLDDIKEICKMKQATTIDSIQDMLSKFRDIEIRFRYNGYIISTGLLNHWKRDLKTNEFHCYLNSELYEVLYDYNKLGFSPIDIRLVRKANGIYTQKLYELLRVWSGTTSKKEYSIEDLKRHLDVPVGCSYDIYNRFKTKVINPAINEINEKLNMKVHFEENKVGRSVSSLTFIVKDYEPRHYNFKEENVIEYNDINYIINKLKESNIKIAVSTLNKLIDEYTEEKVCDAIEILCNKSLDNKIKAPVAYLKRVLENKNEINKVNPLKFNNFEAREYDYEKLERKLLGWDKEPH